MTMTTIALMPVLLGMRAAEESNCASFLKRLKGKVWRRSREHYFTFKNVEAVIYNNEHPPPRAKGVRGNAVLVSN